MSPCISRVEFTSTQAHILYVWELCHMHITITLNLMSTKPKLKTVYLCDTEVYSWQGLCGTHCVQPARYLLDKYETFMYQLVIETKCTKLLVWPLGNSILVKPSSTALLYVCRKDSPISIFLYLHTNITAEVAPFWSVAESLSVSMDNS